MTDFVGAKIALFCDGAVLTYLRDDRPGLPWAGCWDLPGGAREGDEGPQTCLIREVREEFGLTLRPDQLIWERVFPAMLWPDKRACFYAGHLSRDEIGQIVFGDEGQCWRMMPLATWLAHPRGVPEMQRRTAIAAGDLRA